MRIYSAVALASVAIAMVVVSPGVNTARAAIARPANASAPAVAATREPGYTPAAGSTSVAQLQRGSGVVALSIGSAPWTSTFDYRTQLQSRVFYSHSSKLCVHLKTSARGASHSNPGHYVQPLHWHPGHFGLSYGEALAPDVFYPATGNGVWYGHCWTTIKTSWQLRLLFNDVKWASSVHGNVSVDNS